MGVTLVELLLTMSIAIVVLGILTYSSIGLTRSMSGTDQFMIGVANTNRILDAIAMDLRRAVQVSFINGSTITPLKNTGSTTYTVSNTGMLAINIPDYYASNARNNAAGSTYKTTRYPRATLNSSSAYNTNANPLLNGIVPWAEAQTLVKNRRVTRFAPSSSGSGEIQVRYYTGSRSANDGTRCFFRSEYQPGATTPNSTREIAERISDSATLTTVTISGKNNGQTFRLQSSFSPRFRLSGASPTASAAMVEVDIRNLRRD